MEMKIVCRFIIITFFVDDYYESTIEKFTCRAAEHSLGLYG
jgi:hypothetical protein